MSLDLWFHHAQEYFEVFLDAKLNLLESSILCLSEQGAATGAAAGPTADFALQRGLRALPDRFLDPSHEFAERLFIDLPDGYGADVAAAGGVGDDEGTPFLYGEVSAVGTRQLAAMLPSDVCFVDLGSGVGRLVIELAHLRHSAGQPVRCIGVELEPGRAATADAALALAPPAVRDVVCVECGDMLALLAHVASGHPAVGSSDAIHVFCCGVGFGTAFVHRLCDGLEACRVALARRRAEAGRGARLTGCTLLLRAYPTDHPLFKAANAQKGSLHTTWMSDAPAMTLSFQ